MGVKTNKGPLHFVKLEIVLSDAQYQLAQHQAGLVTGECSPQEWLQSVAQWAINERIKETSCSRD